MSSHHQILLSEKNGNNRHSEILNHWRGASWSRQCHQFYPNPLDANDGQDHNRRLHFAGRWTGQVYLDSSDKEEIDRLSDIIPRGARCNLHNGLSPKMPNGSEPVGYVFTRCFVPSPSIWPTLFEYPGYAVSWNAGPGIIYYGVAARLMHVLGMIGFVR